MKMKSKKKKDEDDVGFIQLHLFPSTGAQSLGHSKRVTALLLLLTADAARGSVLGGPSRCLSWFQVLGLLSYPLRGL
jgi:hypothetical protein